MTGSPVVPTTPAETAASAVRSQWARKVTAGLKDGTVKRSTPTYEQDRAPLTDGAPQRNVELIVENFYGCRRATGVGATEAEAADVLAGNLAAHFVEGPIDPPKPAKEAKKEE